MPEGPEIRRAADRVASAIAGRTADGVFFAFERLKRFEAVLQGRKILEVTSRGKAMLIRFEGGWTIYSHNQLYGRWHVLKGHRTLSTRRQLRLAIEAGGRRALLYSASEIEVLKTECETSHAFLGRLGPDVLSEAPSVGELVSRLGSAGFRRRQLGALLLDQGFVAGLGNYLRAEILFESGVHPRRRACECTGDELRAVAGSILALARRTYRTRGVTLPPSQVARLKAAGLPREARRFWVYGRVAEPCRRCGISVEVTPIGGRKCYWCPSCQPADGQGHPPSAAGQTGTRA